MYFNKDVYNSMWSLTTYSGSFIALCGFDGSGKTTQIKELAHHYAQETGHTNFSTQSLVQK
ncbi:ATP-binding cassette domain-containing protein [Bartonella pachyuromydis]|uniref:ABC transporter domain-containing protein n=1 Tax=Bartonella pachyuromydis TaxID=931097 RepID=A0ABP8VCK2_9HYPH